jgi:putative MATE family efflux protein
MGTDGSAWGMNVARLAGLAILLAVLWRGRRGLELRSTTGWAPSWHLLSRIARIGGPSVLEQVMLMLSFMVYAVIALELGTVAFATQRITFNAVMISILPGIGFAIAATTLTGQALGAGRPELAQRTAWIAARLAALWMGAMGLVFFVFGDPLLRVFTDDPEVLELGVPALRMIAVSSPIWAVPLVLSGALRGAGDTRFPLYVTMVTGWLIRVPLGYFFGITLGLGLVGVYAGTLGDAVVGAVMTIWRYRRGGWRTLKV